MTRGSAFPSHILRPTYRFTVRSLGASSVRYGACEICGEHVSDVHVQTVLRRHSVDGEDRFTYHNAPGIQFGHRTCLLRARCRIMKETTDDL